MCVCKCVKRLGRVFVVFFVLIVFLVFVEFLCRVIFLFYWVLFICFGSTCFFGRSIYYGFLCGLGGCSYWGKRRIDEFGGRKRSSRCIGWDFGK